MRSHWFVRFGAAALIGLAFAFTVTWSAAHADGPTVFSDPAKIPISAHKDVESFKATFYISSTETVAGLSVTADELPPDDKDAGLAPIPPSNISIESTNQITKTVPGKREPWTVEITSVPAFGKWAGKLVVEWTEPGPGALSIPLTVESKSKPKLELDEPSKVVIEGVLGNRYVRTVRMRETVRGSSVTGLKVSEPADFPNADNSAYLPGDRVTPAIPNTAPASGFVTMTAEVLLHNVRPGSYSGKLWVTSDNANDLPVDIEVKVKHGPLLPLFFLVLGLLIAIFVAQYPTYGLPRDQVRVGLRELEAFLAQPIEPDEVELAFKSFRSEIQKEVSTGWAELRAEDVQAAQQALARANDLRERWDKNKPDYVPYAKEIEDWQEKICQWPSHWKNPEFAKSLQTYLESILAEKIVKYANANEMRSDKRRIFDALDRYQVARRRLSDLQTEFMNAELDASDYESLSKDLAEIEQNLNNLAKPSIPEDAYDQAVDTSGLKPIEDRLAGIDLSEARRKAKKLILRYTGCRNKVRHELLGKIDKPVKDWIDSVLRTAEDKVTDLSNLDLSLAADLAENAWWAAEHEYGLFSHARKLNLTGDAQTQFAAVKKDLDAFLADTAVYRHSPGSWDETQEGTFRNEMGSLRQRVLKIVVGQVPQFDVPYELPPGDPTLGLKRGEEAAAEPGAELSLKEDQPKDIGVPSLLQKILESLIRDASARIRFFQVATFLFAVLILVLTAWQDQYVGNKTFGSFGNYRDLFLWGFGTGLARQAVMTLVTNLGVPLPGQ